MKSLSDPAVLASVLERLEALRPDSKAQWGRMSPHQMLCHLTDSFRFSLGEKSVSPATSLLHRTVIKAIALYSPLPWPKGVPTRPEVEQGVGGTPPAAEFNQDRETLVRVIRQFADGTREFRGRFHPIFGVMSDNAWYRWGYLHADHHLRQFGA